MAVGSPFRLAATVQVCATPDQVTSRVVHLSRQATERAALPEPADWTESDPCFAPGGRDLAFVSTRSGSRQVWLSARTDIRNPRCLSSFDGSVRTVRWISDEYVIALVDRPSRPLPPGEPIGIEWLRYKEDGRLGFERPESVLYRVGVDGATELMAQPGGSIATLATSAAGVVAYTVLPGRPDTEADPCSVYVMNITSGQSELVWMSPVAIEALALSSDAAALVGLAPGEGGHSSGNKRLWLLRSATAIPLFPDTDLSCEYAVTGDLRPSLPSTRVAFVPGSDMLVFAATEGFDSALYAARLADRSPCRLTAPGYCVTDFALSRSRLAFCAETPTKPLEIYASGYNRTRAEYGPPKQLSRFNVGWAGSMSLVEPEALSVSTAEGLEMQGLLYRAPGAGPSPLLVRLHGGPHLCSGYGFQIEAQIEAAAGYHVLLPNIRGSAGWGEHFRRLSVCEWGRGDYDDLRRWVGYARDLPFVDRGRVFLAGASYGGYVVSWAITQTGDFRGAVVERAVSNLVSKYGTSDNGFTTNRHEMGGLDVFGAEAGELLQRSPLTHAREVSVPVLLLHGECDQRVPIEQSEQWFVALRRLGVDVTFWRWPGESHRMAVSGRPRARLRRLEIILEWLEAHR